MTSRQMWIGLALVGWVAAGLGWMKQPAEAQRAGLSRQETLFVVQQAIREAQLATRTDLTPSVTQALNRCRVLISPAAAEDGSTVTQIGDLRC